MQGFIYRKYISTVKFKKWCLIDHFVQEMHKGHKYVVEWKVKVYSQLVEFNICECYY